MIEINRAALEQHILVPAGYKKHSAPEGFREAVMQSVFGVGLVQPDQEIASFWLSKRDAQGRKTICVLSGEGDAAVLDFYSGVRSLTFDSDGRALIAGTLSHHRALATDYALNIALRIPVVKRASWRDDYESGVMNVVRGFYDAAKEFKTKLGRNPLRPQSLVARQLESVRNE